MNRAAGLAAFAAVVCGALLASANAPPDQYSAYGPQATLIIDARTHLVWERDVNSGGLVNHATADSLCTGSGQRLPTYRELLTLVDEDGHEEWDPTANDGGGGSTLRYIDPNAFPGTPAGAFWSMSRGSTNGTFKVVDFGSGVTRDEANTAYVRCVTDGS